MWCSVARLFWALVLVVHAQATGQPAIPGANSNGIKYENGESWNGEHFTDSDVPEVDSGGDPEGCPRDRDQAAAMGRQCLRKCHADADCISSRKRCLCDGLCGWSCVRPDLHCDQLTAVENGQFSMTGDHFGAKVSYACNEGFYMSGPKERVCQGDSSWSERAPECRKKAMCGQPPQLPHARHDAAPERNEFDVDAVIEYSCFLGYDPQGEARSRCLYVNGTTQWFGLELRCIPRSCGSPGEVEHARMEGDVFTFTSRVTYHCVEGYELVGRANRYCQTNGEWSGILPACRPIQCPIPADPNNGRALYTVVSYNSVVKYECRFGYRLAGPVTRTCGPNKQWEGPEPSCEEIDCGSPGILHNGYLKGTSTRLGSVITFRCFDGMTMEGSFNSTKCLQDASWDHPLPKCLAPCTVPEVENGEVNDVTPGTRVNHGHQITVTCQAQYDLKYNATPAACNNGTWTHTPACIPDDGRYNQPVSSEDSKADSSRQVGRRSCVLPRRLQNSLFYHGDPEDDEDEIEEFPHDSEVRFKCLKPIAGEATSWKLVCEDGVWIGRSYKCDPDDNPNVNIRDRNCTYRQTDPNVVAFRGDRRVTEGKWTPGTVLVFRCRDIGKFRFVGSVRRECNEGVWDGATPVCYGLSQESDYALEKPPTILFRHSMGQIAQSNEGKLMVYPSTVLHLECLWIRKYGTPKWEVSHTTRSYPEGWTNEPGRDSQLEYRLSIYHAQSQDSGRYTCITPAGHRHSVDIIVTPVDCPPIHRTPGLYLGGYSTRMNTKLVFSCERGYSLEGSEQATCLPSGKWSTSPPQCIARQCPELTDTTNVQIDAPSQDVGSTATFSCPEGMSLRGERVVSCLDTGKWSASIPRCTKSVCLPPETPIHGQVVGTKKNRYHMGDMMQFTCEPGYSLEGSVVAVCQDNGSWTAPSPKCIRSCPYPGASRFATLMPVKFYYSVNETVELSCAEGYQLSGPGILQCQEDGSWSRNLPECQLL